MIINITEYLDLTAEKYPDKLAFSDVKTSLTFAQLRDASRRIACGLIEDGLHKEPIVIFMEKSPATIAANLAVVYSGNYYVTLDREMPKHRIEMIFEGLNPRAVICEESTYNLVEQFCKTNKIYIYDEIVKSDIDEASLTRVSVSAIDLDPVYIVFTSGSTGVPKGITASHRAVIDYTENLSELLKANDTTVFGNQAPLYVDACLKELMNTIKNGATTYLIPREAFMFPVKLIEFLNTHKINTICWVSSALSMVAGLKTFESVIPEHLKTISFGSEMFPVKNLNIWRAALPRARFINLYGPTEATGMSCYYEIDREFSDEEKIPIGKPFRNTEIMLIDDNDGIITKSDIKGEICIRGSCLSLGYYNDIKKTSESFTQTPATKNYTDLIYHTGDLGCYNDRGELVFISRKDYQIKHMGYRIELPEIETVLLRNEEISLACCIHDKEKGKLILYYTGKLTVSEVMIYLKEFLPRYMVPNRVFALDEMPLTPGGKIDRVELYSRLI
ncbi:MAG: amino acid adenylation domain-containing protein [Oscillospiraceae bacterium]|nr:amino acid adenylation domain-containing protein [Oscillospiraceae bacterium]